MVAAVPAVRLVQVGTTARERGWVVRDISLDIVAGEFLTVLGPSGSGKTALLTMVAGAATPVTGTIELGGAAATSSATAGVAPERRGIGFVPQDRALFANMSVAENIALPLVLGRMPPAERRPRVAQMLDLMRLGPALDLPLRCLSAGQLFRLSLARALVAAPNILLLDEPFAPLDGDERQSILATLRDLHRRLQVAVLLATRDRHAALALSDRVALLHAGRLAQVDGPVRLYDRPASALVARLTGEDNQLRGRIVGREDEVAQIRLCSGALVEAGIDDPLEGEPLATGADCVVSVRPERIAVAAVSAAEFGPNALAAHVIEVNYLGDHWRLHLSIIPEPGCEGIPLIVKRPAAAAGFAPGRMAAVGWQPSQARVFASAPDARPL